MLDSLKPRHKYYAEHFVNLTDDSQMGCNNQGLLFTKTPVYVDTDAIPRVYILPANPQVINKYVITDTQNWVKVAGVFLAKGGEQYLTIGKFLYDSVTTIKLFQPICSQCYYGAAYNIDDVSVYDLDSFRLQADAGRDTVITKGDSAWIGSYTNGIDTLQWLQNGVTVIDSTRPGFWVYPTSNTYYVLTQTVNGYTSMDTVWVAVKALPVVITSFNVQPLTPSPLERVGVRWETASEINTSHFNIQRSTNGTSFNTIGTVKAIGASSYSFNNPLTTHDSRFTTLYYRLEIVDNNGSISYSEIKELSIINYQLSITPNPAKDFIKINGGIVKEFQITDISGRMLLVGNTNKVDIRGLTAGIYYINIVPINGVSVVRKFMKN